MSAQNTAFSLDDARVALSSVEEHPLAPHLEGALAEIERLTRDRQTQNYYLARAAAYHEEQSSKLAKASIDSSVTERVKSTMAISARDHAQMARAIRELTTKSVEGEAP